MTDSDPDPIAVIVNLIDGASVRFEPHVKLKATLVDPDEAIELRADELKRCWKGRLDFLSMPTPGVWMRKNKELWGGSEYTRIEWVGDLLTRAMHIVAIVYVRSEEDEA